MLQQRIAHRLRARRPLAAMALVCTLMLLLVSCQPLAAPAVAPDVDRVAFPENYQNEFTIFYEFDRPDNKTARVIYANEIAAAVQPGQPFPYGSILVMEVYRTQQDEAGTVLLDENDGYMQGDLAGAFIMRKEPGFGAKYGALRNGEWEYVAYRPDGSYLSPPENTNSCASCHMEAGQGKDWVFGAHRHFDTQPALNTADNAINIVDYTFQTDTLTVTVGTEVTWANNDVVFHTVTAQDLLFAGMLRTQGSFRHTFEEAGTYDYFCAIHPSMRGTVVVTAGE